jgi:thiol-disulfide isomerase/thioredoxin
MKSLIYIFVVLLALASTPFGARAGGDESTLIVEKELKYKNWTFADLQTGKLISLREFARGKRLVLVVYFAPWCGNWKTEAPLVARLYDKYKQHGFDVVAVNNYGTREVTKQFFGEKGAPYTVVIESERADARDKTSHYECRMQTGDARRWGSPYNVFVEPAKINPQGDVLLERAFVAGGELIEADAEKFIRERLGLKE